MNWQMNISTILNYIGQNRLSHVCRYVHEEPPPPIASFQVSQNILTLPNIAKASLQTRTGPDIKLAGYPSWALISGPSLPQAYRFDVISDFCKNNFRHSRISFLPRPGLIQCFCQKVTQIIKRACKVIQDFRSLEGN